MEFYTVQAKNRFATENDNREGPFTLHEAQIHLSQIEAEDCDCLIIAFINQEWHRIEWADEGYFSKPLSDNAAYWDIFNYKEE